MPYIKQKARERLDEMTMRIRSEFATNHSAPGELSYVLTQIIRSYLYQKGFQDFTEYSAILGILESLKLEFNRRLLEPYEDAKIKENGDVYQR